MADEVTKKVKLELVGLDGNAFSLMGAFEQAARRQGWTPEEIKVVLDKCMSADYNNLLCTLMEYTESPECEDDDEEESDERCPNCGSEMDGDDCTNCDYCR